MVIIWNESFTEGSTWCLFCSHEQPFGTYFCSVFSHNELETIFSTLLNAHFIRSENTATGLLNGSTAHHLGIHDDQVNN